MSGNSFGKALVVTTFGESHGPAIGCVLDGCPPGLALTEADIQADLDRRKPGGSKYHTQRREDDRVNILSGVFQGKTTGTPIALLIPNTDQRSKDYSKLKNLYRPSHADYGYEYKYGIRDHRGGGRASARETAARVAAGAVARKWLGKRYGIRVRGYLSKMGPFEPRFKSWRAVAGNPFFCPDPALVPELETYIDELRRKGDSIGARLSLRANGVPPGLGEPVFDKLDAEIAGALMSINAVKAVEIGAGAAVAGQRGTEHRDEITPQGFASNSSGGIAGGISTGQDILAHLSFKPTSSIAAPGRTVTRTGKAKTLATQGRHDPCVGLRAVPIAEAMLALVLMDHALRHRGQNADVKPRVAKIPTGRG